MSLITEVISTGIIFAFTYMCTHFLYYIHPPTPFLHHLLLPTDASPAPGQDLFHPLVLQFCRRKKRKDKMEKHDILAYLR
jgi:hypothetical protein